jgi:hypothetical protein
MPSAAEIKTAARKLPVADRTDLLVDLAMDAAVRKEQIKRLRAAVAEGIRDHAEGRYIELNTPADFRAFAAGIKREGRARLREARP